MTYTELDQKLQGRNRERRKLANNTYAERRGDGVIAIRLPKTDILTYRSDGSVTVNSGGWRTVTTKDRINRYLPDGYYIQQRNNVWYWRGLKTNGSETHYSDCDMITGSGELVTLASPDAEKKDRALLKRIDKYAKLYGEALPLDRPSGGDCWGCHMVDAKTGKEAMGTDHLISHMDEGYVVPSLAMNAMKERGAGPAWYWSVFKGATETPTKGVMDKMSGGDSGGWLRDSARKEIVRWVRRYMRRRLGLAG